MTAPIPTPVRTVLTRVSADPFVQAAVWLAYCETPEVLRTGLAQAIDVAVAASGAEVSMGRAS